MGVPHCTVASSISQLHLGCSWPGELQIFLGGTSLGAVTENQEGLLFAGKKHRCGHWSSFGGETPNTLPGSASPPRVPIGKGTQNSPPAQTVRPIRRFTCKLPPGDPPGRPAPMRGGPPSPPRDAPPPPGAAMPAAEPSPGSAALGTAAGRARGGGSAVSPRPRSAPLSAPPPAPGCGAGVGAGGSAPSSGRRRRRRWRRRRRKAAP